MSSGQLRVEGLGKSFARRSADRPRTLQQWLLRGWRPDQAGGPPDNGSQEVGDRLTKRRFWALREVSFAVAPGEMVGIIGRNGSGKSTLLRLLGGVMKPDEGSVTAEGRISGLLELNTGMHPDLSGRENVFINGVVAGLTRRELAERMNDIIAFAELEDAIDSPVRTYSSGMKLRLGFAVAAHVRPDVLLIDEILSVGDLAFQRKCLDRIVAIKQGGCSIVLITHDLGQVEDLCDRAIWMNAGRIVEDGPPTKVVSAYRTRETHRRTRADIAGRATSSGVILQPFENRFGTFEAQIGDVRMAARHAGSSLREPDGQPTGRAVQETCPPGSVRRGETLEIRIDLDAQALSGTALISVTVEDADFHQLLDVTSEADGVVLPPLDRMGSVTLTIRAVDLPIGDHFLSVGLFKEDWEYAYDYHWRAYPLQVLPSAIASDPRGNIWSVDPLIGHGSGAAG